MIAQLRRLITGMIARPRSADARIATVKVTGDAVRHAEPWMLPLEVNHFVEHALDVAMYAEDELPPAAILAYRLKDYLGEWNNGGHAGYANNRSGSPEAWRDAAEALDILGLREAERILRDFIALVEREPAQLESYWDDDVEVSPDMYALDDRLFAIGGAGPVERALGDRLKRCDWLEVVDDSRAFTADRLNEWIPVHPDHDRRRAARRAPLPPKVLASLLRYRDARGWN